MEKLADDVKGVMNHLGYQKCTLVAHGAHRARTYNLLLYQRLARIVDLVVTQAYVQFRVDGYLMVAELYEVYFIPMVWGGVEGRKDAQI